MKFSLYLKKACKLLCGLFYEATCLALCYFAFVFFSPLSIAITSLGEKRANLKAFRTFVLGALVWFCLFPLPLGVWEGLRLVIVALPGLFNYLFRNVSDTRHTIIIKVISIVKYSKSRNYTKCMKFA